MVSEIIPKCFQNRPRKLQNHSPELPKSSRGVPQSSRGLPKSVPGAPRSPNRAPQAPKGCPRCVQRTSEGAFEKAVWDELALQVEISEPMLTHFLSCALQVASLNVIFDLLSAFSPSLSSLRTSHIAFILIIVLPRLPRYQVVPRVAS